MNTKRIKSDIDTAKLLCSSVGNPTNDEYLFDAASYHTQQAIEKCLKYYLHDVYGEDDNLRNFRTHSIPNLLTMLSIHDVDFNKNHQDLVKIAIDVSDWEARSRYDDCIVSTKNDIENAIAIAEGLYEDIMEIEKTKNIDKNEQIEEDDDLEEDLFR